MAAEASGLNFDMWATIVDRDGVVCAVAFSGADRGSQWAGQPRDLSSEGRRRQRLWPRRSALSTANLYSAVQPGGSLFGLQESDPVRGPPLRTRVLRRSYGTPKRSDGRREDRRRERVRRRPGSLQPPNNAARVVGAVGVSGDTSCADHRIAWRVRKNLHLDILLGVGGVSGDADASGQYRIRHHGQSERRHRNQCRRLRSPRRVINNGYV